VDPIQWVSLVLQEPYKLPNATLIFLSNIFILFAWQVELFVVKGYIGSKTSTFLHCMNLLVILILPPVKIIRTDAAPCGSLLSCAVYVILFLKLFSYAQANSWYRNEYNERAKKRKQLLKRTHSMPESKLTEMLPKENGTYAVTYPFNLSYTNLYYFIFAPTLCYEPSYPRNKSMNKTYFIRRVTEFVFLVQLELALIQQWIVPTIERAIPYMVNQTSNINSTVDDPKYHVVDLFMRLALPNHFLWLLMFYFVFHSLLNACAELLRFADREFYRDWWNADTIPYFWKAWNIPVHKWCVRHVYKPMVSGGYSNFSAQLVVFLLSAFFHEYLVSVPLQLIRPYAFIGMLMQVPLSWLTIYICRHNSRHYGNMAVWISLIWGQPLAILAYVNDYYIKHYDISSSTINATLDNSHLYNNM
jgi:diacylglycerol O-acyltransferase-1